ncbi:MAG TPA: cation diffusion facilitator family transporter [Thermodesulfobacteriota bacterium]|nr:cation diffusion facilitator family transporter [Thermodesulfobacteriota bacterium]
MDIKQKASLFAILSASLLALSKFLVGMLSGSMAVVSSGLDSLLDVFMSGMNFLAIKKAAEPPDGSHHYGHGKVENLAAIAQSLVIILTGLFILFESGRKFYLKEKIVYSPYDLAVMALSLVFSFFISTILRRVGRKTDSSTLLADALHYTSDLYSNSAAILAIVLTFYTGLALYDLLFSVIIGLIIIFSALRIFWCGIQGAMDTSIPESLEQEMKGIIRSMSYPYAGYHKLRTRLSGSRKYVDFHLLLCRRLQLEEAHERTSHLENSIKEKIPNTDVVIHAEPCSQECDLTDDTCTIQGKDPCSDATSKIPS